MTTTAGVLTAAVDAVVTQDLSACTVEQLQAAVELAGPQGQRLRGFASLASATLDARVGGRLPTEDGGSRSVAGWVAEATSESPSAAGRLIRIAGLLQRALPGVAEALLDGRIGFAQAEILTRLVDKIDDASLAEAEPDLINDGAGVRPGAAGRLGAAPARDLGRAGRRGRRGECGRPALPEDADGGQRQRVGELPARGR